MVGYVFVVLIVGVIVYDVFFLLMDGWFNGGCWIGCVLAGCGFIGKWVVSLFCVSFGGCFCVVVRLDWLVVGVIVCIGWCGWR